MVDDLQSGMRFKKLEIALYQCMAPCLLLFCEWLSKLNRFALQVEFGW